MADSEYQKNREALFATSKPLSTQKRNTSTDVAVGEGSSVFMISGDAYASKKETYWLKEEGNPNRHGCLIMDSHSAAMIHIGKDIHFFVDGNIYVVSEDMARNIVPDSNSQGRVSNGTITDVDAVKHGTKYTPAEYRVAYASILADPPAFWAF